MTVPSSSAVPAGPDYRGAHISNVMTSAAAALGLQGFSNTLNLPEASIAVVVMVDGLGDQQLARYSGHARFLAASWRDPHSAAVLKSAVPSTTAAAISSFGTGLEPGQHGMVGYDVFSPELQRVVNMLGQWDADVDPSQWQPHPTVFSSASDAGAEVLTVSRPKFETSQLTAAVLSGSGFSGANHMDARFRLAADRISAHRSAGGQVRRGPVTPLLVYLYVDELDKSGHKYGVGSEQWLEALEALDNESRKFCQRLAHDYGNQAFVVLTADHGMVDIEEHSRVDISGRKELLNHVKATAGEPRFFQLYFDDAASREQRQAVRNAWEDSFGDQAWVVSREEAVEAGWFGEVGAEVLPRIGDLLIAVHGPLALFHTERTGTKPLSMVGQHGSLTSAEMDVPLLVLGDRTFS